MRGDSRGFTYVELMVTVAVLAVLASAIIPLKHWDEKRRREAWLRSDLVMMREAIDRYKKYCDEGMIQQTDVDQRGYPRTLEELVEGVVVGDPESPDAQKIQFLQRIPIDPFTEKPEWGLRSYQDDWDSRSWGGENVYDVYSLSDIRALDGTYYRDW
ncbi:MAG TPA: prepilin-type N-terminal cleavage/methylation domain-containing protein [Candidatus Polarisedimenticolaceae bacterium]|nr:prepilin-type N-terminal cleavage/methylation domain-containing protein [Candidatus Polarisedimenticolaceae bacterium]